MEPNNEKLLKAFERATKIFKFCPNRAWAIAREDLPKLIPEGSLILDQDECKEHEKSVNHELCTFDFCEQSQRDFTAVQQRHECKDEKDCFQLQGLFSRELLENAANNEESTVWSLDGRSMIEPPWPYMAISHVWSDGSGTGAWRDGEVNDCLYRFFMQIAKQFQCNGIWWDTICIPKEKAARNKAIRKIQSNYQDARITLVHDCFLRNWTWDPKTACLAIIMSPWFSRGWTALELAKSRKVKVMFKGPVGPIIKDLDTEILAKDDNGLDQHKGASDIIRSLREGISTLNDLLTVLGPRNTSWPKDLAIIAGLLVGVEVAPKDPTQDIWQQDIYQNILRKIGKISPGHLFHNAATMSRGFSWCPTSLFSMPRDPSNASLTIDKNGSINGSWQLIRVDNALQKNCFWNSMHPLIKSKLQDALKYPTEHVLLAKTDTELVDRALLVKVIGEKGIPAAICCQYVGTVHFRQELTRGKGLNDWILMDVILFGDEHNTQVIPTKNAWNLVEKLKGGKTTSEKTRRGGSEADPNTRAIQEDMEDPAHSDSEIDLILATSNGDELRAKKLLQTRDPNVKDKVSKRTALHYAIWRGHYSIFSELIGHAHLDIGDELGQRPLLLAAERGELQMVSDLLSKAQGEANKNMLRARCKNGQTALHRAVWGGSSAIVNLLLKAKINLDARDNENNTALHIAAEKGFEPVVKWLIMNGSDCTAKNQNNVTPLHYAAGGGQQSIIELLLYGGADIKAEDKYGWSPLHYAAGSGQHEAVKLLLKRGANVNANLKRGIDINAKDDKVSWTPLHFAAINNHLEVVKLLLDNDADVEAEDNYGWIPLQFAELKKHLTVAKLLRHEGSSVNSKILDYRWTPLHCVALNEQQVVVKLLVDMDASVDEIHNDDWAVVSWAAAKGYTTLLQLLCSKGADLDVTDKLRQRPLSWAARKGHVAVVKLLLSKGVGVENYINITETPLLLAAKEGHVAVVELLLDKGANVESIDKLRQTTLSWAARRGHVAVVKLLINRGAKLEAGDDYQHKLEGINHYSQYNVGKTALGWAASEGHVDVVKLLLSKGASFKSGNRGYDGSVMPLIWAAMKGKLAVVKLLLDNGADIESKTYRYQTPISCAASEGHLEVVELLLSRGADLESRGNANPTIPGTEGRGQTPLLLAAVHGHLEVVELLVRKDANLESKDDLGHTPLSLAARQGHVAVVKLLLSKGADLETTDKSLPSRSWLGKFLLPNYDTLTDESGLTPLFWAARKGHVDIVRLLLSGGAVLDSTDKSGLTPLSWAAREGHRAVVDLLLSKGANLNSTDTLRLTPLLWARREGHTDVVRLLLGESDVLDSTDGSG